MRQAIKNWSEFLREPTQVLPHVERGEEVILRRRDGAALRLTLESDAAMAQTGTELAAYVLGMMVPKMGADLLSRTLAPRLPWTRFLPAAELATFAREFAETLEACASIGNMNRVGELLRDWKATAEIHADPALAAELKRPLAGTTIRVARPSGGAEKR
jgi:hypothetical protein